MLNKALTSAQGAVRGPYGNLLALEDLPPPNTHRWVVRRKAAVLAAITGGVLSLEQACDRYKLSVEELAAWQTALHHYGLLGLRTSRLQHYRAKTGVMELNIWGVKWTPPGAEEQAEMNRDSRF